MDLERRARMHAALGDPLRLAIAERLSVSDCSSGELVDALDITTNLLAHHLRVLEQAGLVRRGQSEGDRRRSYVQLAFDDPDVARLVTPWPLDRTGVNRVLFVCTHNSARSQLAVAAWRQISDLPVASAGTSPANRVHPRATATARRHGLRLRPTRPTHIDQIMDRKDLLVAVCDNAHESLRGRSSRQLHWAVPDPVRVDSDEAFESAYREIRGRVDRLAASLAPAGSRNGKQPRHPKDLS